MARMIILFLVLSLPAVPASAQQAAKPAAPASKPAATATKPGAAKPGSPATKPGSYVRKKRDPKKGFGGVQGRPAKTTPVVIGPKDQGPETGFTLSQIPGKPGHLSLAYSSRNPDLVLNTKTGLVAQIYSDEEIEVEPSILTSENWPKVRSPSGKDTVSSDKVALTYSVKNAKKGEEYEVQGEVAYTVCHRKTNVCDSRLSSVYLTISP